MLTTSHPRERHWEHSTHTPRIVGDKGCFRFVHCMRTCDTEFEMLVPCTISLGLVVIASVLHTPVLSPTFFLSSMTPPKVSAASSNPTRPARLVTCNTCGLVSTAVPYLFESPTTKRARRLRWRPSRASIYVYTRIPPDMRLSEILNVLHRFCWLARIGISCRHH